MNSFFAWVGNTDISFYCRNTSLPDESVKTDISGCPLEAALRYRKYDKICLLLTAQHEFAIPLLRSHLPKDAKLIPTSLSNPVDYYEIYRICLSYLTQFYREVDHNDFLLSSGTPAMAAIWLLLGKTRFPGHFLQTFQNQCSEIEIPFRMTVDLIPSILNAQDRRTLQIPNEIPRGFQHIAGKSPAIRKAVGIASKAAIHNISVLLCEKVEPEKSFLLMQFIKPVRGEINRLRQSIVLRFHPIFWNRNSSVIGKGLLPERPKIIRALFSGWMAERCFWMKSGSVLRNCR